MISRSRKITIFIVAMVLTMVAGVALADRPVTTLTNNYYETGETVTNMSGLSDVDQDAIRGAAIAMCLTGAQFDYASGWQGSGAGSTWQGEQALCGAFAKRVDDVLMTGGIGCDTSFNDCGGVISGNWHF